MIEIIPNWHPVFVHFTVALFSVAVMLFVLVRFVGDEKLRRQWEIVAQWNLWLGAVVTLLTVAMGIVAYNSVAHDTPSHAAMTEHRNLALVTSVLFLLLAAWSALRARAGQAINNVILLGLLVAGGLLMSTAWHGGEIVYRYGLGVMSLPKADDHGHAAGKHEHAEDGSDPASGHDVHDHEHDRADEKSYEADLVDCELPEKKSAPAQTSVDEARHDEVPHDETHHADGHADHKH